MEGHDHGRCNEATNVFHAESPHELLDTNCRQLYLEADQIIDLVSEFCDAEFMKSANSPTRVGGLPIESIRDYW
jgi:hypothetical protein